MTTINKINSPSVVQIFSFGFGPGPNNNIYYENFKNLVLTLEQINKEPHSNTPKILSSGITLTGGFPFIEMECIEGENLDKVIRSGLLLSIKEISKICEQLSRTLAYCHNYEIIHGDISNKSILHNTKSGNYILTGFGTLLFPSKNPVSDIHQNNQEQFIGPGKYKTQFAFQKDVYQFGRALYKLLTGIDAPDLYDYSESENENFLSGVYSLRANSLPPHYSVQERQNELNIPDWLPDFIYKCLLKDSGHRINNGVELYDYILINRLSKNKKPDEVARKSTIKINIPPKKPWEKTSKSLKKQLERKNSSPSNQSRLQAANKNLSKALVGIIVITLSALFIVYLSNHPQYDLMSRFDLPSPPGKTKISISKDSLAKNNSENSQFRRKSFDTQEKIDHHSGRFPSTNKTLPIKNSTTRKIVHPWKPEGTSLDLHNGLSNYRVLSKAYFYNSPDEKTRRNAFIVHWNNAILKPVEEKNDFIYIVFTNIWGQTSKGWIRKKDLIEVDN